MKKVTTLIAFICLANTFLTAQNRPIKFGISINPNYSYRYFYTSNVSTKTAVDALESGKFSYSIGAFGEKEINDKVRLRVGINAMNTGFQIVKRDLQSWGSQNTNGTLQSGFNEPYGFTQIRFIYNYINLELPIDFQYFINKKCTFFITSGLSPMVNIYNYGATKAYFNDKKTTVNRYEITGEPVKKISLALQFGIGYAFKLNQKLTLDIEPRFQCFVTPLVSPSSKSGILPYNSGLQIGLTF
jgi:hypothetical protein